MINNPMSIPDGRVTEADRLVSNVHSAQDAPLLNRNPRLAVLVFVVVEVGAVALYLWAGQRQWFFLDEWDFLADRSALSLSDLLRPHNEHWSTLPILVYRAMWNVVGLRTYRPYQLLSILNHLAIAALLRMVMRRSGVGPWLATVSAGSFALLGAGAQNIVWGFQIVFVGPITFGLVHLVCADHDGRIDRRDSAGLLAGLAALASSAIGVVMVVAVGVATLHRRGWRTALFHTAPLAAVYLAWWLASGGDAIRPAYSSGQQVLDFVADAYRATFRSLAMLPFTDVLLAAVLIGGLALSFRGRDRRDARRNLANPIGLLVGGLLFTVVTGWGRAYIDPGAGARSRYLHVLAALTLPALALAAETLYRRWRITAPLMIALLLFGVAGNILQIINYEKNNRNLLGSRELVLALGSVPLAADAPRDLRPLGTHGREVTMGWIRDGRESGKIPRLEAIDPRVRGWAAFLLTFYQTHDAIIATHCQQLFERIQRKLAEGDVIALQSGWLEVVNTDRPGGGRVFDAGSGGSIRVRAPITVELRPVAGLAPTVLCD